MVVTFKKIFFKINELPRAKMSLRAKVSLYAKVSPVLFDPLPLKKCR